MLNQVSISPLTAHLKKFLRPSKRTKLLLVRNCESQGNLGGTLTGWTNVHLSDFGRKQAFTISPAYEQFKDEIDTVHCSDLQRSFDTAFYAMAFPAHDDEIVESPYLREINFGEDEGLHFDNLPNSQKEAFSDPDYKAPGGEGWSDVKSRAARYFSSLDADKTHLIFTHGGLITSYLYDLGVEEMPPNGSLLGVYLKEEGTPESIDFEWHFPYIEEDI